MEKTFKFESNFLKSEKDFVEIFTKIFRNIKVTHFNKISGKYVKILRILRKLFGIIFENN